MSLTRGKTALLILMLMGSSYYGYSKYKSITPSAAINNGVSDDFGPRRVRQPDSPEGQQRRQEFARQLGLTPQQQEQLHALREQRGEEGREGGRDRWTSMSQILTPDQRAKMAAMRDARRDRGAKAALSSADFEKYRQKREQLRNQRGPRGGGRSSR